jgi:hypothetical protein
VTWLAVGGGMAYGCAFGRARLDRGKACRMIAFVIFGCCSDLACVKPRVCDRVFGVPKIRPSSRTSTVEEVHDHGKSDQEKPPGEGD